MQAKSGFIKKQIMLYIKPKKQEETKLLSPINYSYLSASIGFNRLALYAG